jgi:hypothetical protein
MGHTHRQLEAEGGASSGKETIEEMCHFLCGSVFLSSANDFHGFQAAAFKRRAFNLNPPFTQVEGTLRHLNALKSRKLRNYLLRIHCRF